MSVDPVLPASTLDHTREDVAANPTHVTDQLLSRPESPAGVQSVTQDAQLTAAAEGVRDAEGIVDPLESAGLGMGETRSGRAKGQGAGASSSAPASKPKKIAVLTSGGDSAGMNAAGEQGWTEGGCAGADGAVGFLCSPRRRPYGHRPVRHKRLLNPPLGLTCSLPNSAAAKPTSSAKDGKVWSAATPRLRLRSPSRHRRPRLPPSRRPSRARPLLPPCLQAKSSLWPAHPRPTRRTRRRPSTSTFRPPRSALALASCSSTAQARVTTTSRTRMPSRRTSTAMRARITRITRTSPTITGTRTTRITAGTATWPPTSDARATRWTRQERRSRGRTLSVSDGTMSADGSEKAEHSSGPRGLSDVSLAETATRRACRS